MGSTTNGLLKGSLSITDTAYLHRRQNSSSSGVNNWSEDDSAGGYSDYEGTNDTPRTPKAKSYAQQQRERHYKQTSPVQTHCAHHTHSPLQYQYQYASPTPNRPAGSARSMSWIEEYNRLPKKEAQSTSDAMQSDSNMRAHEEGHEVEYEYPQCEARSPPQETETPSQEQESQRQSNDRSPLGSSHDDTSTPISQDISTISTHTMSTSRALPTEPSHPESATQDQRHRATTHTPATPITPRHQNNTHVSDLNHAPESEDHNGADSKPSLESGRSTPVSINRGTPPSFTAQGIRVGSARPSVAVGPSQAGDLP